MQGFSAEQTDVGGPEGLTHTNIDSEGSSYSPGGLGFRIQDRVWV